MSDLSFLLNHDHDHHHESDSAHDEPSEKEKGLANHSCGAATTTDVPTKAYVNSTFDLSKVLIGLTVDDKNNTANSIKYCLETKLLNGEIKNIAVDVSEQTLSVDHKPYFLTASGIVDALDNFMYEVSISLDGGADGLRGLAGSHEHSSNSHHSHSHEHEHNHFHSEAEESNNHKFESVLAKMDGKDFAHLIEE